MVGIHPMGKRAAETDGHTFSRWFLSAPGAAHERPRPRVDGHTGCGSGEPRRRGRHSGAAWRRHWVLRGAVQFLVSTTRERRCSDTTSLRASNKASERESVCVCVSDRACWHQHTRGRRAGPAVWCPNRNRGGTARRGRGPLRLAFMDQDISTRKSACTNACALEHDEGHGSLSRFHPASRLHARALTRTIGHMCARSSVITSDACSLSTLGSESESASALRVPAGAGPIRSDHDRSISISDPDVEAHASRAFHIMLLKNDVVTVCHFDAFSRVIT